MNQSETDLGIVNESQLLGFGIRLLGAKALGLTTAESSCADTVIE
jgi:hypothetical protein